MDGITNVHMTMCQVIEEAEEADVVIKAEDDISHNLDVEDLRHPMMDLSWTKMS